MIYIIDHLDSFTHNVVHQFSNFDHVECDNFDKINQKKLDKSKVIIFSPGPGSPKDYPISSKIYKKYRKKKKIIGICQSLHDELNELGVDVLWDDRENISAGQKFADADLIGNPLRIVVSEKTLADNSVEWKERHESESKLVSTENAVNKIKMFIDAPDNLTSH